MPDLPDRPDLGQLRRQARELLRAATAGERVAIARIAHVGTDLRLAGAQLAVAREYGFASWARLRLEVERLRLIDTGDATGLARLLAREPALAVERVSSCLSGPDATAWNYIGVARFHHLVAHDRMGDIARVLLAAGAPPDGRPDDTESPLITAASYGEVDVARALMEAGADLERVGIAVPGGTALAHAVEFGWPEVTDLLVAAGARVRDLAEAAGVGVLAPDDIARAGHPERVRALRAAAINGRTETIDALVAAGVAVDEDCTGASALHWAAWEGSAAGVAHLLGLGADPTRRDDDHELTPLGWCRHRLSERFGWRESHRDVEALLAAAESRAIAADGIDFEAEVEARGTTPMVVVPEDVGSRLGLRGRRVTVAGTINGTPFERRSVHPWGERAYFEIPKPLTRRAGVVIGGTARIRLRLTGDPVPEELLVAIAAVPGAEGAWEAAGDYRRRQMSGHVASAARAETRERRARACAAALGRSANEEPGSP